MAGGCDPEKPTSSGGSTVRFSRTQPWVRSIGCQFIRRGRSSKLGLYWILVSVFLAPPGSDILPRFFFWRFLVSQKLREITAEPVN